MPVLLLHRLACDVERLGDLRPGPALADCSHDVFCLQLVGENAQSPDGAKAVVGTETVDACSEHDATLVAHHTGCNLSCIDPSQRQRSPGPPPTAGSLALPSPRRGSQSRVVYRWCMSRTNIDIDDELCQRVMDRYHLATKREAVNMALRHLAGEPLGVDEARALKGSGWDADLDDMRTSRV